MLILALKSILGYIIILMIGTNLCGMIVRPIATKYALKREESELTYVNLIKSEEIKQLNYSILFSFIIIAIYLYTLNYFWNIGIAIAGIISILSRLPDLVREIKTGEKFKIGKSSGKYNFIITLFSWLPLLIIWFSLKYLK